MSLKVSFQLLELMQDMGRYRGGVMGVMVGEESLRGRNHEGGSLLEVWLSGLLLSALMFSPSTCVAFHSWHSRLARTVLPLRDI